MPMFHFDDLNHDVWEMEPRTHFGEQRHHSFFESEPRRPSSFLTVGKHNFSDLQILKRMMMEANKSSVEGQHLIMEKERAVRMAHHELMGAMLSAREQIRPLCQDWGLLRSHFKNPDIVEVNETCVAKSPEEIEMHLKATQPTGQDVENAAGKVGDAASNAENALEHPGDDAAKIAEEAQKVENAVEHPGDAAEAAEKAAKDVEGKALAEKPNPDEEYEKVQKECAAITRMKVCPYNKKCEIRRTEFYKDEERPGGGPTLLEQAKTEEMKDSTEEVNVAKKPLDPPPILHECEAAQGHMRTVVALGRKIYGCYEGCSTKQDPKGMNRSKATSCDYGCHKTLQCFQQLASFRGGSWEDKDADIRRICLPKYRFAVEGPRQELMAQIEADEKRIAQEEAEAAKKAAEASMGIGTRAALFISA